MDTRNEYLKEFRESLSKLGIAELRGKASKNFGIKLTRDWTKDDIIEAVMQHISKNNVADIAEGDLKPGYARIKLMPVQGGRTNFPVYTNSNGYECFIPINVEVDVPIKVLETLGHAEEMRKEKNEFDEYVDKMSLSYPYQVLATRDGPDPRPGLEVRREQKLAPYRAFFEKYGYWPNYKTLMAAQAANVSFNMFASHSNQTPETEE